MNSSLPFRVQLQPTVDPAASMDRVRRLVSLSTLDAEGLRAILESGDEAAVVTACRLLSRTELEPHIPALVDSVDRRAVAEGVFWTPVMDAAAAEDITDFHVPKMRMVRWLENQGRTEHVDELLQFEDPSLLEEVARRIRPLEKRHMRGFIERGLAHVLIDSHRGDPEFIEALALELMANRERRPSVQALGHILSLAAAISPDHALPATVYDYVLEGYEDVAYRRLKGLDGTPSAVLERMARFERSDWSLLENRNATVEAFEAVASHRTYDGSTLAYVAEQTRSRPLLTHYFDRALGGRNPVLLAATVGNAHFPLARIREYLDDLAEEGLVRAALIRHQGVRRDPDILPRMFAIWKAEGQPLTKGIHNLASHNAASLAPEAYRALLALLADHVDEDSMAARSCVAMLSARSDMEVPPPLSSDDMSHLMTAEVRAVREAAILALEGRRCDSTERPADVRRGGR